MVFLPGAGGKDTDLCRMGAAERPTAPADGQQTREHVLHCTFTLQTATGGSAGRRQLSFLGRLSSMHVASSEVVKLLA